MCHAIKYDRLGKSRRIYHTNPEAMLPIKTDAGDTTLIPWGRREGEDGILPLGGWARLDLIENGEWDNYVVEFVQLAPRSFAEKTRNGLVKWFTLFPGFYIQGLIVGDGNTQRAYVVTVRHHLDDKQHIYNRWPRILKNLD